MRHGRVTAAHDRSSRTERLLAALDRRGVELRQPPELAAAAIEAVHDAAYLRFLRTAWDRWQELPDAGPEVWPNYFPYWSGQPAQDRRPPCPADHVVGQAGWYLGDLSASMGRDTWQAALRSAAAAVAAAEALRAGHRTAYALCRPPGHHARVDRAAGACFLNNAALAAQHLRASHERVAVLDLDVHHGDGTQQVFYARPDVLTVSLHADPRQAYPYFTGYAHETGVGAGAGCNLNLPVPRGSGWDGYDAAMASALDRVVRFDAGAVVVALGFDGVATDPVGLTALAISDFERLGALVRDIGRPTLLVQEGGYGPEIGACLDAFLSGLQPA